MMNIITSFVYSLFLFHLKNPHESRYQIKKSNPISSSRAIQTQYTQLNKHTEYCDVTGRTALVEHFFNLIFTEFHSTPPVCVCVQMCLDQSTYCYPNGCFKRNVKKILDEPQPVSRIQNDNARAPMFLVDQKNDYVTDFIRKEYPEENGIAAKIQTMSMKNIRPDPFKDKYKSVFRYKKIPQVELRYNLREQGKNTKTDLLKSENVDVSKTRWPLKKHNKLNGHMFPGTYDSNSPLTKSNTFFMSVLPDKDVVNYPPRYTKRELKNLDDTKIDTQTIYIVSQTNDTLQKTNFSIENLITNIIENNFATNNRKVEIIVGDNNENYKTTEDIFNVTLKDDLHNLQNNITTKIQFMNLSSENLNRSKYVDAFNDMIANLSKKIDIQNNTSLEMMRRVIGGIETVQIDISNDLLRNVSLNTETTAGYEAENEGNSPVTTQEIINIGETTPNIVLKNISLVNVSLASNDNDIIISKKSRQRVRKTMQKRKTNQK